VVLADGWYLAGGEVENGGGKVGDVRCFGEAGLGLQIYVFFSS
jgi:hypothetical protein